MHHIRQFDQKEPLKIKLDELEARLSEEAIIALLSMRLIEENLYGERISVGTLKKCNFPISMIQFYGEEAVKMALNLRQSNKVEDLLPIT